MESWQHVWRKGLAPQLSTAGLEALRDALANDDDRLIQGVTTSPPALEALADWNVEAACALTYCGWQGEGFETVAEALGFFERLCRKADDVLGEPAATRFFLHWFDETPRVEMRRRLLTEVARALNQRHACAA